MTLILLSLQVTHSLLSLQVTHFTVLVALLTLLVSNSQFVILISNSLVTLNLNLNGVRHKEPILAIIYDRVFELRSGG